MRAQQSRLLAHKRCLTDPLRIRWKPLPFFAAETPCKSPQNSPMFSRQSWRGTWFQPLCQSQVRHRYDNVSLLTANLAPVALSMLAMTMWVDCNLLQDYHCRPKLRKAK